MTKSLRTLPVGLVLLVAIILACKPGPLNLENYTKQGAKVLIAQNDTTPILTNRQLFEQVWSTELWPNGGLVDTMQLAEYVDSVMMDTVVGFMADVDVNLRASFPQWWGYLSRYHEVLLGAYYGQHVYNKIEIDTAMLLEYRDKHTEELTIPGQVFFYHILVSPKFYSFGPDAVRYKGMSEEELATLQKDYAWELYGRVKNGEPFEAIAQEYSHDKMTQREGGIVGWAPRNRYRPPFDSVAFSAELDSVQPPYQDEDGWHLIKVTDKIEGGPISLDRPDFYAQLYAKVQGEKGQEISGKIVDSLRQELDIEYIGNVVERDVFREGEENPAAVVNGTDTIYFMDIRNLELDYRRAYNISNTTPEIKKEMINRLANKLLIVQAAKREGLDTVPNIRKVEYDLRHETTRSIILGQRYDPNWRPSDSAIAAYYDAHRSEFVIEKPLKIQTILVDDSLLAQFVRDQASTGLEPEDLVKTYIEKKVPGQDARVKEMGPGDMSRERWILLNDIPVSSVTMPLKQDSLWAIIKLVERKMSFDLQHARGKIVTTLTQGYTQSEINRFTVKNAPRFGVGRKEALTPLHLRPLRYRQEMVL